MELENFGAGAVGAVIRFFRNVRNFGSLSLMGKIRTILIPGTLIGVPGYAAVTQHTVMSKLTPTPIQASLVETCLKNIEAAPDYSFSTLVTNKMGCTCTAKMVSAVVPENHLRDFGVAQNVAFKGYEIQPEGDTEEAYLQDYQNKFAAMVKGSSVSHSLSLDNFTNLSEVIFQADLECNESSIYRGDNLKWLVDLKPFAQPIWTDEVRGTVEINLRGSETPILVAQND